jgi:hypothetical protein
MAMPVPLNETEYMENSNRLCNRDLTGIYWGEKIRVDRAVLIPMSQFPVASNCS